MAEITTIKIPGIRTDSRLLDCVNISTTYAGSNDDNKIGISTAFLRAILTFIMREEMIVLRNRIPASDFCKLQSMVSSTDHEMFELGQSILQSHGSRYTHRILREQRNYYPYITECENIILEWTTNNFMNIEEQIK